MVEQTSCQKVLIRVCQILLIVALLIFGFLKPFIFLFTYIREILVPKNSPEKHARKVQNVQEQVKNWNTSGRTTRMCTARPGWHSISRRTPIYKSTLTKIHLDLDEIVQLDPINRTVTVEPLMTMGKLSSILLKMGWIIPVVPELKDLTVGGLICGMGIETSSHKYGLFNNSCVSYEIVLANGEVVKCTKDENTDLFYAIPVSYGTLGFLTAAEIMIVPALKYMKVEYIPVNSLDEAMETFKFHTSRESGNEFIEGIMYSLDEGVIMVGNMAKIAENGKVNSIGRWYKPWFFKHVETFLSKNSPSSASNSESIVEYIPLRDYYHRHSQCIFWELEIGIPYGNNVLFRYLLGWILPPKTRMIKLLVPKSVQNVMDMNHVLQDYLVPLDRLKKFLIFTHEELQIYPIWLCPAKFPNVPGTAVEIQGEFEMFVDLGVYGVTQLDDYDMITSIKRFEMFCLENRGYQILYSDIYLTREEFERMYNLDLYYKVREATNSIDAFPDIYEKVCRAARR